MTSVAINNEVTGTVDTFNGLLDDMVKASAASSESNEVGSFDQILNTMVVAIKQEPGTAPIATAIAIKADPGHTQEKSSSAKESERTCSADQAAPLLASPTMDTNNNSLSSRDQSSSSNRPVRSAALQNKRPAAPSTVALLNVTATNADPTDTNPSKAEMVHADPLPTIRPPNARPIVTIESSRAEIDARLDMVTEKETAAKRNICDHIRNKKVSKTPHIKYAGVPLVKNYKEILPICFQMLQRPEEMAVIDRGTPDWTRPTVPKTLPLLMHIFNRTISQMADSLFVLIKHQLKEMESEATISGNDSLKKKNSRTSSRISSFIKAISIGRQDKWVDRLLKQLEACAKQDMSLTAQLRLQDLRRDVEQFLDLLRHFTVMRFSIHFQWKVEQEELAKNNKSLSKADEVVKNFKAVFNKDRLHEVFADSLNSTVDTLISQKCKLSDCDMFAKSLKIKSIDFERPLSEAIENLPTNETTHILTNLVQSIFEATAKNTTLFHFIRLIHNVTVLRNYTTPNEQRSLDLAESEAAAAKKKADEESAKKQAAIEAEKARQEKTLLDILHFISHPSEAEIKAHQGTAITRPIVLDDSSDDDEEMEQLANLISQEVDKPADDILAPLPWSTSQEALPATTATSDTNKTTELASSDKDSDKDSDSDVENLFQEKATDISAKTKVVKSFKRLRKNDVSDADSTTSASDSEAQPSANKKRAKITNFDSEDNSSDF